MRVTVDIPDQVWWRAVAYFERQGTTTREEIEGLMFDAAVNAPRRRMGVKATLRAPTPQQVEREAQRAEVVSLVADGRTDQEISIQTGMTRARVGDLRRASALEPNKPKPLSERTEA